MQYAIITSEQDPAGINIREQLLNLFDFKEIADSVHKRHNIRLYLIKGPTVYAEDLDKKIDADFFIFATRHQSKEGVHSLSCHSPGNWSKAEFGGKDNQLCIAPALMLKKAYLELKSHQDALPDHNITLEVTHHGPLINKPIMFIEIGSTAEHWGNKKAGEAIAKTIMRIIEQPELKEQKIALAIGGPHYCNNFNKILERTDIAIGHICPKYSLENLDEQLIKQAIEKTKEDVNLILLDWKGLGKEKARVKEIVDSIGMDVMRTDKVK
jgi:D-aminoacyl-tRNA deacylase